MDRAELIARYRDGVADVHRALAGVADDETLDRAPVNANEGDSWTVRRIVHHLADSEMTSAIRLRRLLAEDEPEIGPYDEVRFADVLYYDERPIGPSLKAFEAARESSAQLLERLGDADWSRAGTHPEHGRYSVDDWLELYAAHAHDHADQIRRAIGVEC